MYLKKFTLLFLFVFFVSCSEDKSSKERQSQDKNPAVENGSTQEEDQIEKLYTITIRGGWPITNRGISSLYFDIGTKRHFKREDIVKANWCVVLHESDFQKLSITWQFDNGKILECSNIHDLHVKCSEHTTNLLLHLPRVGYFGTYYSSFPLNPAGERNPDLEKCFKL